MNTINKIFNLFLLISASLVVFIGTSCDKKKQKDKEIKTNLNAAQKQLLGTWESVGKEIKITANDSLTYPKIKNALENELSVIRKYIEFNDSGKFKTFISPDSNNWHKRGRYIVLDKDLDLEFQKKDSSTILFAYEYYIDGDSLFITKDDTQGIGENIADHTNSDVALVLRYGVKKRDEFKLDEAALTRVFVRVDSLREKTKNDIE